MKFFLKIAGGFIIIAAVIAACQREISAPVSNQNFDANAAKEWWYGTFRKSPAYSSTDWNSLLAPPIGSSAKKYPNWPKAISYQKSEFNVVELPLFYVTNRILLPGMQRLYNTPEGFRIAKTVTHKLLLIQKKDKSVEVRTCSVIPSEGYAKKTGYDISHVNLNNMPADFEGYMLITGWDSKLINLVKVEKGRPINNIHLISKEQFEVRKNGAARTEELICPPGVWVPVMAWVCAIVPTGDAIADQEHCNEIGHWTETNNSTYEVPDCYEEGDFDPLDDCLNYVSQDACYCILFGLGCDGEGQGLGECDMTNAEAQTLIAAITSTEGYEAPSGAGPESTPDVHGIIRQPIQIKRNKITYNYGLGYSATYTLIFNAVRFKTTTNSIWKWESVVFDKIQKTSGGAPPCFTNSVTISMNGPIISADKKNATFQSTVTSTVTCSCLFGSEVGTMSDEISGDYQASDW